MNMTGPINTAVTKMIINALGEVKKNNTDIGAEGLGPIARALQSSNMAMNLFQDTAVNIQAALLKFMAANEECRNLS